MPHVIPTAPPSFPPSISPISKMPLIIPIILIISFPSLFLYRKATLQVIPLPSLFLLQKATSQLPPSSTRPNFRDDFRHSGLETNDTPLSSLKYGGPCIADLDSDGTYDIILNFHNRHYTRIFFGSKTGKFEIYKPFPSDSEGSESLSFRPQLYDVHGISVAQLTARSMDKLISFSVGGGGGNNLRTPEIYRINEKRELEDVSHSLGFGMIKSRPRNTVFMDLYKKTMDDREMSLGGPDALFTSYLIGSSPSLTQYAYENRGGDYKLTNNLGEFEKERRQGFVLTDVDGDGMMEVIAVQEFRIYKVDEMTKFQLVDVSKMVFPRKPVIGFPTVAAVVEFDMDNDGDFDLYVARAPRDVLTKRKFSLPNEEYYDVLLRNDNGTYVDVTEGSGVLGETASMGVTVGDFNNDGWVDVLVVQYEEEDVLLLNRGDGTFERVGGLIQKEKGGVGNNAIALDYNLDGTMDAVVGHGAESGTNTGPYQLLNNILDTGGGMNWLHVTVYNDEKRTSTSLHALVTVGLKKGVQLVRRVGDRGGQKVMGSYLDTVHFGLGSVGIVNFIRVDWTSGLRAIRTRVSTNRREYFGIK